MAKREGSRDLFLAVSKGRALVVRRNGRNPAIVVNISLKRALVNKSSDTQTKPTGTMRRRRHDHNL